MEEGVRRVLIVDSDPDTLVTLQQVLERAKVDTTITWDETETRQLLAARSFDLLIVGDHPPELNAAEILHDLGLKGIRSSDLAGDGPRKGRVFPWTWCAHSSHSSEARTRVVLEQVARGLSPMRFEATLEKAGLAHSAS